MTGRNDDNDRLKSLIERANDAGEKAFNSLIDFQTKIEEETGDRGVAEALCLDASMDILVSIAATTIANGQGLDEDGGRKIAKKLRSKVRKIVRDFFLENGAKILTVDLEPGASNEEDDDEEEG